MLRKYPADLEPLREAVRQFLPVTPRANGDCLPKGWDDPRYVPVKEEALKLLDFDPPYFSNPVVRMKPSPFNGRYDSSILHTDTWSGNGIGAVVMIPIEGDFETGGVEFFEPTQHLDLLLREYADYRDAPDFKPKYLGKMEPGYVYVVSSKCLHRTMIGGRRISVDFRTADNLTFSRARNYESRNRS